MIDPVILKYYLERRGPAEIFKNKKKKIPRTITKVTMKTERKFINFSFPYIGVWRCFLRKKKKIKNTHTFLPVVHRKPLIILVFIKTRWGVRI